MKRFRVVVNEIHSHRMDIEAETDLQAQQIAKYNASLRRPDKVELQIDVCSPLPELEPVVQL